LQSKSKDKSLSFYNQSNTSSLTSENSSLHHLSFLS
jgi:hypothetical protein